MDVKHCHGYLGYEFLSAVDRDGKFGGSYENRTRFLREIVAGIRAEAPSLEIGVRLSAYDFIPFKRGEDGIGIPENWSLTTPLQRPALFPPSDGYQPPEDPLAGVARLINATAELKTAHPNLCVVGTGYSYLQKWLPNVAQNVMRTGKADLVGIGRMVLTYPELCADVLEGNICRTFSDCTTAPRNGMVSGCYPLDEFYKERAEAELLKEVKLK